MRRQFGPRGEEEIPVLEYQMQVHGTLKMTSYTVCTDQILDKKNFNPYRTKTNILINHENTQIFKPVQLIHVRTH